MKEMTYDKFSLILTEYWEINTINLNHHYQKCGRGLGRGDGTQQIPRLNYIELISIRHDILFVLINWHQDFCETASVILDNDTCPSLFISYLAIDCLVDYCLVKIRL